MTTLTDTFINCHICAAQSCPNIVHPDKKKTFLSKLIAHIFPHQSHSPHQSVEHDQTHKLSEEDEWSEDGPHWPECNV